MTETLVGQAAVDKADALADIYHRGQLYGREPYIEHPRRVREIVAHHDLGWRHEVVALLHDTVEDTGMDADDIALVFGTEIADAVVALSKVKGQSHEEYLDRVCGNSLALVVKVADAFDNLKNSMLQEDLRRTKKYLDLLATLVERMNAD
jgi:(p)ppGpp synthase/HD superfamily hydrolase